VKSHILKRRLIREELGLSSRGPSGFLAIRKYDMFKKGGRMKWRVLFT